MLVKKQSAKTEDYRLFRVILNINIEPHTAHINYSAKQATV